MQRSKRKYKVWDGKSVAYVSWLTESEAGELRRSGYYVYPCN